MIIAGEMIIAVDFDGTLCKHEFPSIGEENIKVIQWVKQEQLKGAKLILWTCREGIYLNYAVEWCRERGINFDAINENVPSRRNQGYALRKPYANIYLDDRNLLIENLPDIELDKKESI